MGFTASGSPNVRLSWGEAGFKESGGLRVAFHATEYAMIPSRIRAHQFECLRLKGLPEAQGS